MNEKRTETRFLCADLITVRVEDARGAKEIIANLEEISPSGACVQLEAAVLEGADIELICENCQLRGIVRHCRFSPLGYDVGIALDEHRGWDRQQYVPKHLLEIPLGNSDGS
jgi:hypothetical protein